MTSANEGSGPQSRAMNSMQRFEKPALFVLSLIPLFLLAGRFATGDLGPNPIEAIIRYLGDWALRFILIALAVTPARLLTEWNRLARLRRTIGLFAFSYVLLHVLAYVGLDQAFDLDAIWRDVTKRTYITVGMTALLMLIPLAVTSTDAMIRRLGGKTWLRLHRLVYPAAIAAVIHYVLMIKAGYVEAAVYALILSILLGFRILRILGPSRRARISPL